MILTVLIGFAGFSVDLGNWYLHIQNAQRASGSAALAGDPYPPGEFTTAATQAMVVLKNNGFDVSTPSINAGTQTATFGPSSDRTGTINVVAGEPSQLQVTVHTTTSNYFFRFFGFANTSSFTRDAIAEQAPGIHLSAGKNLLGGHEPLPPGDALWAVPPNPTDGNYWAAISGKGSYKEDGDRFATGVCQHPGVVTPNPVDGCSGALPQNNNEFTSATDPATQYNYHVHVAPSGTGTRYLLIEAYDAGYAETGSTCSDNVADLPGGTDPTFCSGDNDSSGLPDSPPTTYYKLSSKVDGGSIANCNTYPGNRSADASYLAGETWIHNWQSLCDPITVNMAVGGDFVLNVSTDGGSGQNAFALRAGLFTASSPISTLNTPPGFDASTSQAVVTINADVNEALYNAINGSDSAFPIAQIPPSWAGQQVTLQFFDIGDTGSGTGAGSLTLVDGHNGPLSNCEYTPPPNPTFAVMSGCQMDFASDVWQGQTVTVQWTVPASWATDPSCVATSEQRSDGCWLVAKIDYGNNVVNDYITSLNEPDTPLRLIK